MATAQPLTYAAGADWFSQSGFSDTPPAGAVAYAKRLVRYIGDASTVRARTMDEYGKAPPLANIRRWRADWLSEVEAKRASRAPVGEPEVTDDVDIICAAIAMRLVAASADAIDSAAALAAANDVHGASDTRSKPVTYLEVLQSCAARCELTVEQLLGSSRSRSVVRARQFAATVLRARGNSYPCVGRFMGDRDHSTIMHSVGVFFTVGMKDPFFVDAWMAEAPCVTKMARSAAELDMLMGAHA